VKKDDPRNKAGSPRRAAGATGEVRIWLVADGIYHHGREILMGAKEWCLRQPAIRTRILQPKGLLDEATLETDERPADAMVVFTLDDAQLEAARQLAPWVVTTSPEYGPNDGELPRVVADDHAVGREAAEYFLRRGYQSFACIHRTNRLFSTNRITGFKARIEEASLHPLVIEMTGIFPGLNALADLPRPLAVFAPSDVLARRLIDRLQHMNLHIPRDVAVLGVDDDPYQDSLSAVPLSSVRLAGHSIGAVAAELAHQLASGARPPEQPLLVPPVGIASRLSTDNIACQDKLVAKALGLIQREIRSLLGAEDLVSRIGIPRRTLEWRFRKELGRTIHEELSHARLQKARELLATTDLTAEEIAARIGLSEGRMLTLLFKRMAGMTPTEFHRSVSGLSPLQRNR
jgi:LacI family transcriptional regulator